MASFVYCVDSMAEILPEITLHITTNGLFVRQCAAQNSLLLSLYMHRTAFDHFSLDKEIFLRVHLELFAKVVRTAALTDHLGLEYKKGGRTLYIYFTDTENGNQREYQVPACLSNDWFAPRGIEKVFNQVIHLNSTYLKEMITNVFPFSDTVEISIGEMGVCFAFESPNSLVGRGKVIFGGRGGKRVNKNSRLEVSTSHENMDKTIETDMQEVRAKFHTRQFSILGKFLSLHSVCNIYLAKDYPLILETLIGKLGKMRICIMHLNESTNQ